MLALVGGGTEGEVEWGGGGVGGSLMSLRLRDGKGNVGRRSREVGRDSEGLRRTTQSQ